MSFFTPNAASGALFAPPHDGNFGNFSTIVHFSDSDDSQSDTECSSLSDSGHSASCDISSVEHQSTSSGFLSGDESTSVYIPQVSRSSIFYRSPRKHRPFLPKGTSNKIISISLKAIRLEGRISECDRDLKALDPSLSLFSAARQWERLVRLLETMEPNSQYPLYSLWRL
ncbi:MAG: hypothetical protein HN831_02945 [Waddliaceae bacterium]|jgi:hypothetical protein|nr:hypothetical protein [Candidatus Jacksonbacteria bacterium]MBT7264419.1 hypothetical protein [Waddliaceae bacterium]MBT7461917.1 hypothetical protein [Waddliaceae bacterium]